MDCLINSTSVRFSRVLHWIDTIPATNILSDKSTNPGCLTMASSLHSDAEIDYTQSSILDETSQSGIDVNGPPSILPRLGTNYAFVKWTQQHIDTFTTWWATTQYARLVKSDPSSHHTPPWNSTKKSSNVWTSFDQVAEAKTGHPKVACRTCGRIMNHPSIKNTGTSNMSKHLKQSKCDFNARRVLIDDTESISVSRILFFY
jgi:BED zinc finger